MFPSGGTEPNTPSPLSLLHLWLFGISGKVQQKSKACVMWGKANRVGSGVRAQHSEKSDRRRVKKRRSRGKRFEVQFTVKNCSSELLIYSACQSVLNPLFVQHASSMYACAWVFSQYKSIKSCFSAKCSMSVRLKMHIHLTTTAIWIYKSDHVCHVYHVIAYMSSWDIWLIQCLITQQLEHVW